MSLINHPFFYHLLLFLISLMTFSIRCLFIFKFLYSIRLHPLIYFSVIPFPSLFLNSLPLSLSFSSAVAHDDGIYGMKIKLHNDLISNSSRPISIRPVKNDSSPVNVKIRMLVEHIVDFVSFTVLLIF